MTNPDIKTSFIAEYIRQTKSNEIEDASIATFKADDADIEFTVNLDEHPELGNLQTGEFYIFTIESYNH